MKKILLLLFLFFSTSIAFDSYSQKGHYKGGKGSSHKGGSYKNKSTNNHYRKRKK